ncbi:major facilitator superfamily domain-containing protein [Tricladium varicosporioides]|nr:major facilitator superfamily domain-containing protein [Hymenoscyphus varicosporioides]
MAILQHLRWLYQELGLHSLYNAGLDAWLIIAARCCRMIAFGTNSLILALFFSALKFSDTYIGLFMTLTLLGDVLLSLVLTVIADRVGRRRVLLAGSGMMVASGAIFAIFENYWILLVAAVAGVMSATGGDFGPFRAIEESILSTLTRPNSRADVLAWYVTVATLGQSIGTEACGRIVHFLENLEDWTLVDAYHTVFWMYTGVGILNIIFMSLLSDKCEAQTIMKTESDVEEAEAFLPAAESAQEMEERTSQSLNEQPKPTKVDKQSLFSLSLISQETRSAMFKLWFLLFLDSLADGMTAYSLTTFYMDQKFHLLKSTLGDITSISYFLSFLSSLSAAPLCRRLGLVNTMVFTHLPSSVAVLLFPLPNQIALTVILLMIRTGFNNMDQAPRAAFIAAVVKPEERTAIMGITSMLRTLASTAGPTVTGILAGHQHFWIAFVTAGALRIAYDLGLFAMFVNMKLYQHEEGGPGEMRTVDARQSSDEEELRDLVSPSLATRTSIESDATTHAR